MRAGKLFLCSKGANPAMPTDPLDLLIAEAQAADLSTDPTDLSLQIREANGKFQVNPTITIDAGATGSVQIAIAGDPSRWMLIFANLSGNQILIGIDGQTSPTQSAIPLAAGGIYEVWYKKHAVLVTKTWYCYAALSPSNLTIHEIVIV